MILIKEKRRTMLARIIARKLNFCKRGLSICRRMYGTSSRTRFIRVTIWALGWPASHGGDGVDAGGGVADWDGSPLPWEKQGGVRMNRMIVSNTIVATGIGWSQRLSLAVVGCRTVMLFLFSLAHV